MDYKLSYEQCACRVHFGGRISQISQKLKEIRENVTSHFRFVFKLPIFQKNLVHIGSLKAELYLENLQNCDWASEKRLYLKNYIGNRQNVTRNFRFVWI